MQNPPEIVTERTILRLQQAQYAPLLQQYYLSNRIHLAAWEPQRDDAFYTLDACQQRLLQAEHAHQQGQGYAFMVLDKTEQQMIASCAFNNVVRGIFQACHLGYSVDAKWQGQGIMHEALQAAMTYMFEQVDLHRIMANYIPRNERSARLLQQLGFEREGYAKKYLKINGVWEDHVLTALVRERD